MTGSNTKSASSAWKREQMKIVFQYALMLIASWVLGWILPRFLGDSLWQEAERAISTHFTLPFAELKSLKELLAVTYRFCLPVLICTAIVCIFSFSSLSCLVTDGVLVYLGARTGCTVSMLYTFSRSTPSLSYQAPPLTFFLFLLCKLLLLVFFFIYSVRMAKYAYRLRFYSQEGRTLFHPHTVWSLLAQTLLCMLVMFMIHLLYGCSIYLVSK